MPYASLEYVRLKAIASLIRFGSRWSGLTTGKTADEHENMPSREPGRSIRTHIYRPAELRSPCPVLINWHGSGFVIPMHGSDELFCRRVSCETEYTVIDATYRLAPEHPFPAAFEDAEDIVQYVLDHPEQYDSSCIALCGFSAGGNLALAVASSSKYRHNIKSVICFYSPTNLSVPPAEKRAPDGSAGTLPAFLADTFNAAYAPPDVDRKDPRVSPSFADAADYPDNILIVTTGKDNLAPEAEELAHRLEQIGKMVTLKRSEDVHHGWDKKPWLSEVETTKRDGVYNLAITFLLTCGSSE